MTQSGIYVLNISSDEEDEYDNCLVKDSFWKQSLPSGKRHLMPVLPSGDDDVVLIEKLPCPQDRTREKALRRKSFQEEGNDDDCCILDGNPDGIVCRTNSHINGGEDLVVTGESGPVACRDFPHARHLCAKFPFRTTAHEKFCDKCHCYICDIPAPCLFWSQGEVVDHCHASDKEKKWRVLRQIIKPYQSSSKDYTSQVLPATSISQPLLSRLPMSLTHDFQNYSLPPQINSSLTSSISSPAVRSATPSSSSTSLALPMLSLTSVQVTGTLSSMIPSYSGPFDISTTSIAQIATTDVRTSLANDGSATFLTMDDMGGISSQRVTNGRSLLMSPSTPINGAGVYYQNNGMVANWFVSPTSTTAGRTRRRGIQSHLGVTPSSSARSLQSCTTRSLVQKNGPLQSSQERLDWARMSPHPTISRHCRDRLTNLSYGAPLQSYISTRQCVDCQPTTLEEYLFEEHRNNEQTSLQDSFESNQSESYWIRTTSTQESHSDKELVLEQQTRVPALLEQAGSQPVSPCVERIADHRTLLSSAECDRVIRQVGCLAALQSSNHSNGFTEAVTAPLDILQSEAILSQNVQQNTMVSDSAWGTEAHGQSQVHTSGLGNADVEKIHQNDELEVFLVTPYSSQDLQEERDYMEGKFPTHQGLNVPVSLADALTELDADDIWGDFDFEFYGL
eukprot:c27582_g1_i1 orf=483-2513(+)